MRPRIAAYDSTFGWKRTERITLHKDGVASTIASKPAVRTFDDTQSYYRGGDEHVVGGLHPGRYQPEWYSVVVPKTGTTIAVTKVKNDGTMQVRVAPKASTRR
jgi:immune inhibitor A